MKFDTRKVFERLKVKEDSGRARVSVYVDLQLWKTFQAVCSREGVSASKMLEELMREVVDDHAKELHSPASQKSSVAQRSRESVASSLQTPEKNESPALRSKKRQD